ncbi:hypothetical protein F0267_01305 [Vibrio coralliilyticus]|uniref:Uncharacterized protein n=3 Tax=Vibrio TaxID=662 RepID=A0AAN0SGP5_9VIBR|nr:MULTISPECIES: hypothetical protein [Vibrio]CAH1589003.1 conserved hypothetical protein [Vibrio jasicida]AIW22304.1 hypothetical protein IX92_24865 [Vibrio coralliilyticus]MCZ2798967.1 hypothetical protein [Vibrio alginolyticus]NOH36860.1 hypothetical protein [Vibrio coralliilyticus]PAW02378.1 hypothetical protein CKJ79_17090 [Vibrio coralliilyticus]
MQPYGFYSQHDAVYPLDVADTQMLLPKGARIRNKKQKRRLHKKSMRQHLKRQTIKETVVAC